MQHERSPSIRRAWSPSRYRSINLRRSGFLLVEVILASTIFVFVATILIGALLYGQEATAVSGMRARAVLLADEGIEAVHNLHDEQFTNLTNGTYGLTVSGGQWALSGTSDVTGIFTREVAISQISPNEKNVMVNVTWQQTASRTGLVSRSTRLTNWQASWARPSQVSALNLTGIQNGVKIRVQGSYAYLIRTGSTPDFLVFDITDPANPVQVGSLALAGNLLDIFVAGSFAYVASDDNVAELQIINITTPASPVSVGTYNDAGGENPRAVFVAGTSAYLAMNGANDFVIVNVATPSSPSFVGGLVLAGTAFDVTVLGTRAYVASDSDSQELQAINISNPAAPSLASSLNLAGTDNSSSIVGFSSTVVLGRSGTGSISTINVTNPAPALLGTVAATGVVNDLALGNENRYVFASAGTSTPKFLIYDINVPATPSQVGSLNLAALVNGVVYDETHLRAYLAGTSDTQELLVLMPL
jgi:hypothetical protein